MATRKKTDETPAVDETPVDETPVDDVQPDEDASTEDDRGTVLVDGEAKPIVRDPSEVDPTGKLESEVLAELAGADPVDINRNSQDAGPVAPVDDTPPASVYVEEPDRPVTVADVAAFQGIQIAPDGSSVREIKAGEGYFMSEGMRNDLEIQGFAIDPATGAKVMRADDPA